MLDADLPETLGRAVVGQLEANGALKLFILGEDRDTPLQADPVLEDTMGWDQPCQGPQVPLAGAVTVQKKVAFKAVLERSMHSPTGWWDRTPPLLAQALSSTVNGFSAQGKFPQETKPIYSSYWQEGITLHLRCTVLVLLPAGKRGWKCVLPSVHIKVKRVKIKAEN